MTRARALAAAFAVLAGGCAASPSSSPAVSASSASATTSPPAPSSSSPTPTSASTAPAPQAPAAPPAPEASNDVDRALDAVARIHGAPGPWAVLGYRMAERALSDLHLPKGSFALAITHRTPKKVQFACIADGAAASSGASVGKLNLSIEEATEADLVTVFRNRDTGASVAFRPTAAFRERYLDADRARARELGREVMQLPEDRLFERVDVR